MTTLHEAAQQALKALEVVAQIAALQLAAKVCGGSLWAWALAWKLSTLRRAGFDLE